MSSVGLRQEQGMGAFDYIENSCFMCGAEGGYTVLYEQNFDDRYLDERAFSPKTIRKPLHFRTVRCNKCSLVYATPIISASAIEHLYRRGEFTYSSEVEYINKAYSVYFNMALQHVRQRSRMLEIGCGNGAFLEVAAKAGFTDLYGVEPNARAVENVPASLKGRVRADVFRGTDYQKEFFDLVCFFQVLDHATDPNEFLKGIYDCLHPGGVALALTHNISSLSAKIMGEKCNIVDVNHVLLFDKTTLAKFFEKHGFRIVSVFDVRNSYSIGFWVQILNLPDWMTNAILGSLSVLGLKDRELSLKAGNIGVVAVKP